MEHPLADVFQLMTLRDTRPADDALELALASDDAEKLHTDHAVLLPNGATRPITWAIGQLWDEDRQVSGIVVVFRDPDEMSLTPEELIRANKFDSLGHLASGIAHDFNNLLSTILGGISLAKDNRDYNKLDDAETTCMAAKTLTRQLLAFPKGTPGGAFAVVEPGDIIDDAVRVSKAGSPVQVSVAVSDSVPLIEVDRGQLIQVFQNLIINAMQAMAEPSKGRIEIRARTIELSRRQLPPLDAGKYVQIEVQDNGNGIPADKIDRIFEPFFTTKKSGTGLGLATVLSIVRKHGGQLGVDSTEGVGTTFTAILPATEKTLEDVVRRPCGLARGACSSWMTMPRSAKSRARCWSRSTTRSMWRGTVKRHWHSIANTTRSIAPTTRCYSTSPSSAAWEAKKPSNVSGKSTRMFAPSFRAVTTTTIWRGSLSKPDSADT